MNNQPDDLEDPFKVEPAEPAVAMKPAQPQFANVSAPKNRRKALPLILLFAAIAIGALLFHFKGRLQAKPRVSPGADPTLTMKSGADAVEPAASGTLPPLNVPAAKATGIEEVLVKAAQAADNSSNALSGQADLNRKIDELAIVVREIAAAQKARDEREAAQQQAAAEQTAAATAARARQRAARGTPQRAAPSQTSSAKEPTAKLLAVDVWGGQPSAALGHTGDGRVKFLQPSESVGGVSMLAANPEAQSATMKVGDRTIQLERDQ